MKDADLNTDWKMYGFFRKSKRIFTHLRKKYVSNQTLRLKISSIIKVLFDFNQSLVNYQDQSKV